MNPAYICIFLHESADDNTTKPESILEFCNTNRSPDYDLKNKPHDNRKKLKIKENLLIVNFVIPADYRVPKKDKSLDLARELKKDMEQEGIGDANCNWYTWNDPQRLRKRAGGIGNRRMSEDYLNYSIAEVDQNIEKSP